MDRGGANTWIVAVLALAVGFLAALLIFGGDDTDNTSATISQTSATTTQATTAGTDTTGTGTGVTTTSTTTAQAGAGAGAPQTPDASIDSCINLWNQANNRGNQTFIVNLKSQQAIRVNVGKTSSVPAECLITIVANNGDAYVFPEGGGTTYPYAQAPGKTDGSGLPPNQKIANALEQSDGTLKAR